MTNTKENQTEQRVSRAAHTQYFTDLFIRNNKETLYKLTRYTIVYFGQNPDNMDLDDIIDKAVFVSLMDLYSRRMMDKTDCFADIVRRYIYDITEFQVQEKMKQKSETYN